MVSNTTSVVAIALCVCALGSLMQSVEAKSKRKFYINGYENRDVDIEAQFLRDYDLDDDDDNYADDDEVEREAFVEAELELEAGSGNVLEEDNEGNDDNTESGSPLTMKTWSSRLTLQPGCSKKPSFPWRNRMDKGTIRLNPRPMLIDEGDASCPTVESLDAGACILQTGGKKPKVACLPSFLIIGTMKSGTAELQGWLSQHPALYRWKGPSRSGAGEAHFFDNQWTYEQLMGRWKKKYLYEGFQLPHLKDAKSKYTFEKTPSMILMEDIQIALLHRMLPSVKLITILRNPTARAYSHFQHKCRNNNVWRVVNNKNVDPSWRDTIHLVGSSKMSQVQKKIISKAAERGIKLNPKYIEPVKFPCNSQDLKDLLMRDPLSDKYLPRLSGTSGGNVLLTGMYSEQLKHWEQFFRPDQIKVVFTEELFTRPFETMEGLQEFLGIPKVDFKPMTTQNDRGYTVLKNIDSKANKKPYPPLSEELKILLDNFYWEHNQAMTRFVSYERLVAAWKHPETPPELDDILESEYEEFIPEKKPADF